MHPRRLLLAPLLLSVACEPRTDAPASTAPAATAGPVGPAPVQRPTLVARDPVGASVVASLDTTVDPCTDFYRYACGGWMKKTTRPPDKARYGRGFGELADRNNALLRKILEDAAAAKSKAGSVDAQLGSFWSACMDEAAIDRAGIAPLAPLLSQVTAVRDEASLMRAVGKLHAGFFGGGGPLFTFYIEPDAKRPDVYVAQLLLAERFLGGGDEPEIVLGVRRWSRTGLDGELIIHPIGDAEAAAKQLEARSPALATDALRELYRRVAFTPEPPVVRGRLQLTAEDLRLLRSSEDR